MSQIKTNTTDLQAILDLVNALPEAGGGIQLPTLTNPGSASDLAVGKELLDENGEVVTGTLPISDITTYGTDNPKLVEANGTEYIRTMSAVYKRQIIDDWGKIYTHTDPTMFGDAETGDVTAGKTFTSARGVKLVGTKPDGGSSGLPAGISAIETGTFTPSSDISANYAITHNLGEMPSFFIVAPEDDYITTENVNYLMAQVAIMKAHSTSSYSYIGRAAVFSTTTSGTVTLSAIQYLTSNTNITDVKITVAATTGRMLKAGVTYRWVVGVVDGIN